MADEIKLKAPTVEQQVVVNINGEDKLKSFADTLDKISNNKNLQKYWKTQQDLINATADAYGNFQKKASKDNASELIKVTNALKAMSGTDLSHILPDFDKISKSMAEAQKVAGDIDSAFSVKGFKEAFDSFETLKAYGTDIQKLFSHFGVSSDIGELQQNVRLLEGEVEKLTRRLSNARNANEELRNEFENFKVGSGFADKLNELDRLKLDMQNIRNEAIQTFNQFLDANKIDRYDWFSDDRFAEYFEKLENGTLTATDAIRRFKSEYSYLLEESYKSSGDSFGLDQLQAFSTKLDSIFHQVEETSNKINDILSNGVIAKSVQNLSEDTTLSDSQRSIFGNILQDEESLKSITALFQKLIDETTQTKNTEIFNTEQFAKIESLFTSIGSSLSSIKGVLVDVGDGEELSPLLSEINNIQTAIVGLSSSLNNLHFNMNIDMGTDNQMEAKIQEKAAKALNAYEKLFNGLKMSGYGGEVVNNKFFDFDINKFDTTIGKVKAYKDIIERLRKEAKEYYGGTDLLRTHTDDKLWRSASSAGGQLTQAINETVKNKTDNPLTELFGKTDLSGVIEQLNTIVFKLDEISVSAKGFTETFKNGLNVNASVEEIEKLTNRVKELEAELAKIKTPITTIPSEDMKDAFPKTSENLEQVAQSEQKVQQEAVATDKALDNISFTPNTEGFEDIIAKFGILREQAEQITKIVKTTKQTADGTPNISYKATLRNGSSYYLGDNSTPQVLNASETVYDAKADNAKKLERGKQIWNELTTSLERYATIQKRIASNNALSTDNAEAIKLLEHIHELQRNDILPTEKLTASNEKLQQINQTVTDLKAKLKESTLDSLQGSIDKYQKIYDQRKTYSSDFTPSEQYTQNLTELNTAIGNLVEYRNTLKNVSEVTVKQEAELKGLVTACEKASDSFKSLSASEKGASQIAIDKLVQRINKDLDECTNYSKEAKLGLRALRDELESANPRNLKEITSEIINIENAEIKAGRAGRSFFDTLKNSGFHQIAAQMAGMFGLYDVINIGRQAISTIVDLDDALLDLKKTTSMSSTKLNNFYYSANDVAKQMGVTTKSIIEQASAWSRLGYSSNEQATEMAKLSSKFASISPGMDTDQAQEGMVSIMKAWQINPEDVEKEILDPINQLGNKFAESNDDIVEGMKRSAAALAAVGTDYKDAYSLFTGIQEVLQNSEVAGRALRSISMRIRGYDENSEDGFEQTDEELKNITGDLIDLTKTAEHTQGVSIFKEGSTTEFKSLVDYFGEIHDIWDEMSQKQQNDFLQKAFGKTQAQAGSALIQNYDAVKASLAEIDESAGSADKEMSTVEQTLSYKINALKETWVGCAQQILDRGDLGIAISGLNGVSKVITGLIDNVGLLKTAAMGVAAALSFNNVGILELN
nr:MAG TPA: minor tail protein [Caudoviricetes sp.]